MSFSQALEVVIGLIFVYYVLGSVVSLITQWINESFETRGKSLEKHLQRLLGDENQVGKFVALPQLQALRPIRYKNLFSFINASTEPKKVEKIPVATLVDSYFDFMRLTEKEASAAGVKEFIEAFPNSESKQALLTWVEQGVTNVEELRKRSTTYFNGVMEQAGATFRSNARSFVIMLSIFLTLVLGTDSIQLAQTLWTNSGLRAVAVAQAEMVVQQEGMDADMDTLIEQISALNIVRFGWWSTELPPANSTAGQWVSFVLLKFLGLGLTAAAVSQGSSFWYDLLKKLVSKGGSSEPKG